MYMIRQVHWLEPFWAHVQLNDEKDKHQINHLFGRRKILFGTHAGQDPRGQKICSCNDPQVTGHHLAQNQRMANWSRLCEWILLCTNLVRLPSLNRNQSLQIPFLKHSASTSDGYVQLQSNLAMLDTFQAPHSTHFAYPCCLRCSQDILLVLSQKSMTLGALGLCSPLL